MRYTFIWCLLSGLVFARPSLTDAQIPRGLPRDVSRLVDVNKLLDDTPVTTSFDDAVYPFPYLDGFDPGGFQSMDDAPRGASGEFLLQPGLYEFVAQSYCLHAGTHGPGEGSGYLHAPLEGSQAGVIRSILQNSVSHPEIEQREIQLLIWAILARAKFEDLPQERQRVASSLLTPEQIANLNRSALDVPASALKDALPDVPPAVRQTLEAEAELRDLYADASASYEDFERVAVPSGELESREELVPSGRWSYHPDGYFVRYKPASYATTPMQIYVPEPFTIGRDPLGRIVLVADQRGNRIEFQYDDSITPLSVPDDPSIRGYAFRSIRFVRPDPAAEAGLLTAEWENVGWTFVTAPSADDAMPDDTDDLGRGPNTETASFRTSRVSSPAALQGERYEGWQRRYEQGKAVKQYANDFQERAERHSRPANQQDVDDFMDASRYQDGVDAALGQDPSEKVKWIDEHGGLLVKTFEWAGCKLAGGCDEGDAAPEQNPEFTPLDEEDSGKPDFTKYMMPKPVDPSGYGAVPADRRRQRLALSARAAR